MMNVLCYLVIDVYNSASGIMPRVRVDLVNWKIVLGKIHINGDKFV